MIQKKQRTVWQFIAEFLLYLTPLGYLLGLISLHKEMDQRGIYVALPSHEAVSAKIKKDPTNLERLQWFFSGIVLCVQAVLIAYHNWGGDWGGAYAITALTFGLVSVLAALFPNINFNKPIFHVSVWAVLAFLVLCMLALFVFAQCREYSLAVNGRCLAQILN